MIKRFFLSWIILLITGSYAFADRFQILLKKAKYDEYVSYAKVRIVGNKDKNKKFEGYTDKYGRIVINYRHGKYTGSVYYRKRWWKVDFIFDGRKNIKKVYIY